MPVVTAFGVEPAERLTMGSGQRSYMESCSYGVLMGYLEYEAAAQISQRQQDHIRCIRIGKRGE